MAEVSGKKTGAGKTLKQLAPCWIISFVFCYMLFLYEPLMMYCTNKDQFRFDLRMMAPPLIGIFLMFFFGSAAVLTLLFFISKMLSKECKPHKIILLAVFYVFIVLYIQGNFLINNLPPLDGSEIDWGAYKSDNIITLVICLVLAAALLFAMFRFDLGKLTVYAAGASLAVFVVMNIALATTAAQCDPFEKKTDFLGAADGFNAVSADKNFFIFMVDSQSAPEFTQVISSDEQFAHTFDDFTYFTDALSVYAYTRDSVPFLLSGHINKNEEKFSEYSKRALNDSGLFRSLDENGYDIRVYDNELVWYGNKEFRIKNDIGDNQVKLKFDEFFKQEMTYVWFKYLPYAFKKAAGIENLDFTQCIDIFNWRNDVLYNEFKDVPQLSKSSEPQFRFIHAEGPHVPLNMDENFNRITGGTYIQKTTATVKLLKAFIDRLKENGVYDNSVIVILADHGYQPAQGKPENYILSRYNALLLIKGAGEKHDLVYSDKPVSFLDLPQAYDDLLDGKQSGELFPEAEFPRTRTVIWYEYCLEQHMVEYQTDGKATEWDKFRETGSVYDLN